MVFTNYAAQKLVLYSSDTEECTFTQAWAIAPMSVKGTLSMIPEPYLNACGIWPLPVQITEMEDRTVRPYPYEEKGYLTVECRYCDAYDAGACMKYGGICSADECDPSCFHSETYQMWRLYYCNACLFPFLWEPEGRLKPEDNPAEIAELFTDVNPEIAELLNNAAPDSFTIK